MRKSEYYPLLRFAIFLIIIFALISLARSQDTPLQQIIKYDRASVTISPTGCSGTLICPRTVLTAGHCYKRIGQRVTVNLSSGSRVEGKVIATRDRDGVDVTIIRLDSAVNNLDSIPVASEYPPDGSEIQIYGRAAAINNSQITRFSGKVEWRGDGGFLDVVGEYAAAGGESGGGGFYKGKVIGVVARTGSKAMKTGVGSWTGLSNTPGVYEMVSANPCSVPACLM